MVVWGVKVLLCVSLFTSSSAPPVAWCAAGYKLRISFGGADLWVMKKGCLSYIYRRVGVSVALMTHDVM